MSSGNDLVLREDLWQQIDVPAQKGQVVADLVVKLPALAGVASRKGSPIPYRMVSLCPSPHRQGLRGTRQSRESAPIEYRIRNCVKSSNAISLPKKKAPGWLDDEQPGASPCLAFTASASLKAGHDLRSSKGPLIPIPCRETGTFRTSCTAYRISPPCPVAACPR